MMVCEVDSPITPPSTPLVTTTRTPVFSPFSSVSAVPSTASCARQVAV